MDNLSFVTQSNLLWLQNNHFEIIEKDPDIPNNQMTVFKRDNITIEFSFKGVIAKYWNNETHKAIITDSFSKAEDAFKNLLYKVDEDRSSRSTFMLKPDLHVNEITNTLDNLKKSVESHTKTAIELAREDLINYGEDLVISNLNGCHDDQIHDIYLRAMKDFDIDRERFIRYEKIRVAGEFNMLTQEAMRATGLSLYAYSYVLQKYAYLRDKYIEDADRIHKEFIDTAE